ncbi:tandem pore domain K+ channel [Amanita muscaria]
MNKQVEVQLHLDCQRRLTRPWWFISFTFPLICAAFAPLANLFSILSFVEPWVVVIFTTVEPKDPPWLLPLNSVALATAVIANILLLLNFARRIRNIVAQPLTILLYISGTLHVTALSLTRYGGRNTIFSQAYYYALLASIMHIGMATLLLLSFLPSLPLPLLKGIFPAYSSRALILTAPQRTLMLQSLFFTLYLALGAGIFAALNQWSYLDAIYWTDYSLLTIGFGSDFTLVSPVAKGILIPYVAIGIFILGLVIGSIRKLFLANFRERILWGKEIVEKEREKWWRSRMKKKSKGLWLALGHCRRKHESDLLQDEKYQTPMKWSKEEWELMKALRSRSDARRRYVSLLVTSTVFFSIWFGGALVFVFTERAQHGFTYSLSLYFTYVSLLTIGYGDVIPRSGAGKPVFVLWSISSIPAVTLLISDIQDTFARWVKEGPVEHVFGRWLVGSVGDDEFIHEHEDKMGEGTSGEYDDVQFEKSDGGEIRSVQGSKEGLRKAHAILRAVRSILEDEESKQYSWEEWQKWLWLLELDKDKGCEEGHVSNWTWIGDDGPLLTRLSEKIWLLKRLRQKVDQQLQDVFGSF